MRVHQLLSAAAVASFAGVSVAAPAPVKAVTFPHHAAAAAAPSASSPSSSQLPNDGFPKPNASQLAGINAAADGTLANSPPPPALNSSSLPVFQLIAFNENFEVAFFNSLLYNVTNDVPGYQVLPAEKVALVRVLTSVLAQEELHAINAANVLTHFKGFVPTPCTYKFPTTDLPAALALAETFTSLVLGTLQDASQILATNGDAGPVRAVASVIGQEGEQNGFYRSLLNRKPSQKPFLTTSVGAFAFSALQEFVVSCPFPISQIPIPVFPPLTVVSGSGGADISAQDQLLAFTADLTSVATAAGPYTSRTGNDTGLYVTYLTGQDTPASVPVLNAQWTDHVLSFDANFPFTELVMDGFTIAALTTGANFTSPDAIPAATLAAPGLLQVNDALLA
ncbi:sexual development protein [Niveomyces insectorum RCEF 264]|uniref:Sexual development protein n=1 Tax=Niveomyces insectorum RCEF 264 TaxID=1081102 RepID=A0A167P5J0_9HYPO|nr:sexual development protein [Niveomyces insectorum RCEF 264]